MKKAIVGNLVKFSFDQLPGITLDRTKISGANQDYASMFGLMSTCGDAAALSRVDKDGNVRTITEAMRREAVAERVAHFESGALTWTATTRAPVQNPIWAAMAAKRGVAYDVIAAEKAAADLAELEAM